MSDRVVITGLGLMSGLGLNLKDSWDGILNGKSAIKRFTLFDPADLSSPFGVELPDGAKELFKQNIKTRNRKQMTRGTMICIVTAKMALEDSGIIDPGSENANADFNKIDKQRIGVVIGATGTGYVSSDSEGPDKHRILKNMANSPSAWINLKWKLKGPSFVVSTACSSGIYALNDAVLLIKSGICDAVIVGSSESTINYLDVQGFCSMLALSDDLDNIETSSRPFDKNRNGFVIGEGSGILIVESLKSAERRGAKIYAETYMPGLVSEAYNIMSPEPAGKGMARAMKQALKNSALDIYDVDYINAHGTSTQLNDLYETQAIKEVFGDRADSIPVSSTKSMTGHCLSGTAGMEAVICCKALAEGIIPPTKNLRNPDPELNLDYVPNEPRNADLNHIMCNSFAFGGHNGVAVFSRYNK